MNTPEISQIDIILSKLQEMQTTVVEIKQDHQQQMKLKVDEIGMNRTALFTLGKTSA